MRTNFDQLLEAGCHFGHLKRKWNPAMAPYIYTERNGIHIIDLNKTVVKIDEAAEALKNIVKSGRKVLFVGTKKQAQEVVAAAAQSVVMPYITERWAGGMLTNFPTIRKAVKKMSSIDKMMTDGTFDNISKREKLQITRQREKLEKNLGSIADLNRLPSAVFVVDVMKEHIAVAEANRLGIPVFGIVDTNSNPNNIDFIIPANDDATKSIEVILGAVCEAIKEGLAERQVEKADEEAAAAQEEGAKEEAPAPKERRARVRKAVEEAPVKNMGNMSYNVIDIEGIGEKYAAKLEEAGIKKNKDLLEKCATPKGRAELAEATGIAPALILKWTNHADLMRINGIAGQFAELLEAAGVDTVKEFRHRVAANLQPKLEEVNAEKNLCNRVPAVSEVEKMVEQAKVLEPIITY